MVPDSFLSVFDEYELEVSVSILHRGGKTRKDNLPSCALLFSDDHKEVYQSV